MRQLKIILQDLTEIDYILPENCALMKYPRIDQNIHYLDFIISNLLTDLSELQDIIDNFYNIVINKKDIVNIEMYEDNHLSFNALDGQLVFKDIKLIYNTLNNNNYTNQISLQMIFFDNYLNEQEN